MQTESKESLWLNLSLREIIERSDEPNMKPEDFSSYYRHNREAVHEIVLSIAREEIEKKGAAASVPGLIVPTGVGDNMASFILLVQGAEQELKKVAGYGKPFDWYVKPLQREEPSLYVKMRESAFKLLIKAKVKDLSNEEVWRAILHSRNAGLYFSIIREEILSGLTIEKLYERGRNRSPER